MNLYLDSTEYINWKTTRILSQAKQLAAGLTDSEEIAKKCFEYVRDEIKHSVDYQLNPVTCKASDVLKYKTGFCFAKSHLLAALLRANSIPAGLCYQRLITSDNPTYCLHGLNAIYLEHYGWYRVDARGNKKGVTAEFCPPHEKLSFSSLACGETDLLEIFPEPLSVVVDSLTHNLTYEEVADNLPDIELVAANQACDYSKLSEEQVDDEVLQSDAMAYAKAKVEWRWKQRVKSNYDDGKGDFFEDTRKLTKAELAQLKELYYGQYLKILVSSPKSEERLKAKNYYKQQVYRLLRKAKANIEEVEGGRFGVGH